MMRECTILGNKVCTLYIYNIYSQLQKYNRFGLSNGLYIFYDIFHFYFYRNKSKI